MEIKSLYTWHDLYSQMNTVSIKFKVRLCTKINVSPNVKKIEHLFMVDLSIDWINVFFKKKIENSIVFLKSLE